MIPRYSRKEMSEIWSDNSRYQIWLDVETLALEKMADEGSVPQEAYDEVKAKGAFDASRVLEIEAEVKHDVIAFLTNVAEHVGPASRYVHRGMTSNDLLDTTFAVQLKRAGKIISDDLEELISEVEKRASEFKYTPCIGRSHGIHAEPTTFGIKLLSWYSELKRQHKRFNAALEEVCVGKMAGAVGTYASVSPGVEAHVMQQLGLKPETVPSQIVHRDRHAAFFNAIAGIGSSIERFCVEIRHLQRTEVHEVEESFTKGQKGSSAMPHKKNPILCENLTGLARLLRSYAQASAENVALWHERDISHSSVERVIAPDATIALDFMLQRFIGVVKGMAVFPEKMQENLDLTRGLVFSGSLLIALVDNGITREDAYRLIQKHALAAWEGGDDFKTRVTSDPEISTKVPANVIEDVFDIKRHTEHVDFIFDRALGT